ncbi:hypothetical protein HZA99_05685 [Candidatus Woesearchaeota archaeon]|nr:hypothetical protein [Candidatus Woesearchaeota archaeon]
MNYATQHPELLFVEIERNKAIILQKSSLQEQDYLNFIQIIKNKIKIISEREFLSFVPYAEQICPDSKDISYFALALSLHCPLWSNERKLQQQDIVRVFSTSELLGIFHL